LYSHLPNLILAFHGCNADVYSSVVKGLEPIKKSVNDYDWLGSGVYFWENSYERAYDWAKNSVKRTKQETGFIKPAVIGAIIDLGHCLNLTDYKSAKVIKETYNLLSDVMDTNGIPMPDNEGDSKDELRRKRDCLVFNDINALLKKRRLKSEKEPFDSIRGVFVEGKPMYKGAGYLEKTHIQLCIINPKCIKGYFAPLDNNGRAIKY
jgi:hypothetical protein